MNSHIYRFVRDLIRNLIPRIVLRDGSYLYGLWKKPPGDPTETTGWIMRLTIYFVLVLVIYSFIVFFSHSAHLQFMILYTL